MTREDVVNEILRVEWDLFTSVKNLGGPAECQGNKEEFLIMRSSQWEALPDLVIKGYLGDLKISKISNRNLMFEKYARMMEFNYPEEYDAVKHLLPELQDSTIKLIKDSTEIYLKWELELFDKYPLFSGQGRPLHSQDDKKQTSIETYLSGELHTYSHYTNRVYNEYIHECLDNNINLVYNIWTNIAKKSGYESVEDAENKLRG